MKKEHIKLSEEQEAVLRDLIKRGELKVRKMKRVQGLLELNKGKTYTEVSDILDVKNQTVARWAKAYKQEGMSMLDDKPRSGRPNKFSAAQHAKVTALACSEPPEGRARWTLRLLADKVVELNIAEEICFKQVGNILKKHY